MDFLKHMQLLNDKRNSMLYWYPKIQDLPTPKADWLKINAGEALEWLDRGIPQVEIDNFKSLARELGYPVFMRTDNNSGKHTYKYTCYVESEDKLPINLYRLLEDEFIKDLVPRAIVFREFVELDWRFKAFSGELPIAPEVRVLIKDHKIERWLFYWPASAIVRPSRKNWRDLLSDMYWIANRERDKFLNLAKIVAERFDGYWSVDFARTKKREWILIDMALGEVSWKGEELV